MNLRPSAEAVTAGADVLDELAFLRVVGEAVTTIDASELDTDTAALLDVEVTESVAVFVEPMLDSASELEAPVEPPTMTAGPGIT